jgi:hypothetical protein
LTKPSAVKATAKRAVTLLILTRVAADHEDAVARESTESNGYLVLAGNPLHVVGDFCRNRVEA